MLRSLLRVAAFAQLLILSRADGNNEAARNISVAGGAGYAL